MRKKHNLQYKKTTVSNSSLKANNRMHTKLDQRTIPLSVGTRRPMEMPHLATLAVGPFHRVLH